MSNSRLLLNFNGILMENKIYFIGFILLFLSACDTGVSHTSSNSNSSSSDGASGGGGAGGSSYRPSGNKGSGANNGGGGQGVGTGAGSKPLESYEIDQALKANPKDPKVINFVDENQNNAVHLLANKYGADLSLLSDILKDKPELAKQTNQKGETPLDLLSNTTSNLTFKNLSALVTAEADLDIKIGYLKQKNIPETLIEDKYSLTSADRAKSIALFADKKPELLNNKAIASLVEQKELLKDVVEALDKSSETVVLPKIKAEMTTKLNEEFKKNTTIEWNDIKNGLLDDLTITPKQKQFVSGAKKLLNKQDLSKEEISELYFGDSLDTKFAPIIKEFEDQKTAKKTQETQDKEDEYFAKINNFDWKNADDALLFTNLTDLIKQEFATSEKFAPILNKALDTYLDKISKFNLDKGPLFDVNSSFDDTISLIDIEKKQISNDQQVDKEVIPVLLAKMAKKWPSKKLFKAAVSKDSKWLHGSMTAFQTLVAISQDTKAVEEILKDNNAINELKKKENSPFAFAQSKEMVDLLASKLGSAQAECQDSNGYNFYTLHCALFNDASLEVINALIKKGADPMVIASVGENNYAAINIAAKYAKSDVYDLIAGKSADILKDDDQKARVFLNSLQNKKQGFSIASKLITDNPELAKINYKGNQPLTILLNSYSPDENKREVAIKLINAGAALTNALVLPLFSGGYDEKDKVTILALAATTKDKELVEAILKKAKETGNIKDILSEKSGKDNKTALEHVLNNWYHSDKDKSALAIEFINAGAELMGTKVTSLNHNDKGDLSILALAVVEKQKELVSAILKKAKETGNIKDILSEKSGKDNKTALEHVLNNWYHSDKDKSALAIEFINAGAELMGTKVTSLNHNDKGDLSILALAVVEKQKELVSAILKKAKETGNIKDILSEKSGKDNKTALEHVLNNWYHSDKDKSALAIEFINAGAELMGTKVTSLNHNDKGDLSILALAVIEKQKELVEAILKKTTESGNLADILKDKSGKGNKTALEMANEAYSKDKDIIKLLEDAASK